MNKLLCILLAFFSSTTFAMDKYVLDPDHTYVTWDVSHFGFSSVTGKFFATGVLEIDEKNLVKSTVNVTIDTKKMITGIPKLDNVLSTKSFFDIADYPTATFKSEKVTVKDGDTATVAGVLTIKGISKKINLQVKLNRHDKHPYNARQALGFSATGTLNRSDFDMRGYLPGVGDKVELDIQAEAFLESK